MVPFALLHILDVVRDALLQLKLMSPTAFVPHFEQSARIRTCLSNPSASKSCARRFPEQTRSIAIVCCVASPVVAAFEWLALRERRNGELRTCIEARAPKFCNLFCPEVGRPVGSNFGVEELTISL